MCEPAISRRKALSYGGGLALAGVSLGAVTTYLPGGGRAIAADPAITADEVLALLMEATTATSAARPGRETLLRTAQLWRRGRRRSR
jgi:hypothetical protein